MKHILITSVTLLMAVSPVAAHADKSVHIHSEIAMLLVVGAILLGCLFWALRGRP